MPPVPAVRWPQPPRRQPEPGPAENPPPPQATDLAQFLLQARFVPAETLRKALATAPRADLPDALRTLDALSDSSLARAYCRWLGLPLIDPALSPPDPALIDRIGALRCLEQGVLPMGRRGGRTILAMSDPRRLSELSPGLEAILGPISPAVVARDALEDALWTLRRDALRRVAEARVPLRESCRQFRPRVLGAIWVLAVAGFALLMLFAPSPVLAVLAVMACTSLLATLVLRAGALIAMRARLARPDPSPQSQAPPRLAENALPIISVIVPLYRENDIAPRLLRRLGRIDYPRARMDVILAVEEEDQATRRALVSARLPGWMRVVTVPDGPLRTKPRALNYALPFCRGSIIGIYDAEDAPARDQLRKVAERFAAAPPDLACLQGVLDYYNPGTNWVARCFALEYAIWFRVIMPGLQHLGIPLPLGGTTLFMRRAAIEDLGAWDAHNVTEDADLGIRIALRGYRTEMLDSTTEEEANCRPSAWVRQRSRWIKGHMLTWAVHMRRPLALWRALGPVGFLGYQVVFLGAQVQFLLAPVLWSFWTVALGLGHPAADSLPRGMMLGMIALVVLAEALNLILAVIAARKTRHIALWHGAPFLQIYFPMASLAAWQALHEALTKPYFWAKTSHGHFDGAANAAAPQPPASAKQGPATQAVPATPPRHRSANIGAVSPSLHDEATLHPGPLPKRIAAAA